MADDASTTGDAEATAATAETAAAETKGGGADDTLREAGKAALDAERTARRTAEAELKKLQKAQADREAADAKAKGDFEKLATDRQAEIDRLTAEVARRDADALRSKVAAKHKLPDALAARLAGETEDELEADAKELAKLVGSRAAPDTEAGAGAKGSAGPSDRPIPKTGGEKTPAYTFDGRPKVAFPSR